MPPRMTRLATYLRFLGYFVLYILLRRPKRGYYLVWLALSQGWSQKLDFKLRVRGLRAFTSLVKWMNGWIHWPGPPFLSFSPLIKYLSRLSTSYDVRLLDVSADSTRSSRFVCVFPSFPPHIPAIAPNNQPTKTIRSTYRDLRAI